MKEGKIVLTIVLLFSLVFVFSSIVSGSIIPESVHLGWDASTSASCSDINSIASYLSKPIAYYCWDGEYPTLTEEGWNVFNPAVENYPYCSSGTYPVIRCASNTMYATYCCNSPQNCVMMLDDLTNDYIYPGLTTCVKKSTHPLSPGFYTCSDEGITEYTSCYGAKDPACIEDRELLSNATCNDFPCDIVMTWLENPQAGDKSCDQNDDLNKNLLTCNADGTVITTICDNVCQNDETLRNAECSSSAVGECGYCEQDSDCQYGLSCETGLDGITKLCVPTGNCATGVGEMCYSNTTGCSGRTQSTCSVSTGDWINPQISSDECGDRFYAFWSTDGEFSVSILQPGQGSIQ